MKLFINKNCKYIKGAKNAAIYDLKSQEVYAINEVGKYTLDKFLNDENYIGTPNEKDFIESLIKLDLLSRIPFEAINISIIIKNVSEWTYPVSYKDFLKCTLSR